MVSGGREAARKRLRELWQQVADTAISACCHGFSPFCLPCGSGRTRRPTSFLSAPEGVAAQFWSPYSMGPNSPTRWTRWSAIWISPMSAPGGPKLFVGATNVRTGKVRVFHGGQVAPEALLASACLPEAFQAVEIKGEAYWDGGFTGNPSPGR